MASTPIAVRPFEPADFDQVVAIMPPEWLFDGLSPQEARAQAAMDFAGVLAASNLRLVAQAAPEAAAAPASDPAGPVPLAGILFARLEGLPDPQDAAHWRELWECARATLLAGGPSARLAARYEEQLGERGQLLVDAAGDAMGPDNELELFVANPAMRGCGAGGALMAAFEQRLRELGHASYWLQTDTTCTWDWYERHGYLRAADVELDERYPMPPAGQPTEPDAPVPHVFMYRKDL